MYILIDENDECRVMKTAKTIKELRKGIDPEDWPGYIGDSCIFHGKVDSKGNFTLPIKKLMNCGYVFELFTEYTGPKKRKKH